MKFIMKIPFHITLLVGKAVANIAKLVDKNRGTNISGKIATALCNDFVKHFKNIDFSKVIMVTGTNGKSTTTNLIAHTIKQSNRKTATNGEGANMMGGVATTLIKNSTLTGKFNKEFLVLEIDERSLPSIYKVLPAKNLVITNLQKDQVQRNGDPDFIYRKFAEVINKDIVLFLNNEEPRSKGLEDKAGQVIYFSVNKNDESFNKSNFYDITMPCPKCNHIIKYEYFNLESIGKFYCTNCNYSSEEKPDIYVSNIDSEGNKIICNNETYSITYNTPFYIYNYAATVSVSKKIGLTEEEINQGFKTFVNPGERREILKYKDKVIHYLRMKQENPETLQSALDTVAKDKTEKAIFIGLYEVKDFLPYYSNTFYFYDCNFKDIANTPVEKYIVFSKTVCYDTANRIIYDGADPSKIEIYDYEEDISVILKKMDDIKTKNIYILTGMKPYSNIKNFLAEEEKANG